MITIRKGVFETNSSSTHVLTISKNNEYTLPKKINFSLDGEFGWDYQVHYDSYSKCQYLIEGILSCSEKTEHYLSKLKSILHKHNIAYTIPDFYWHEYDHNGKKCRYAEFDGYIDHGFELEEFLNYVLSDEEKLFNSLFNDDSYVSTGNDNENGYYVPGIGVDNDYDEYNKWQEEVDKLEEECDIFFKGN